MKVSPCKMFTSCLHDSLFAFLTTDHFIKHEIQKAFLPELSVTSKHTAEMANIVNTARIKQGSVVITSVDLKNAFGEVHHNLVSEILRYHPILDQPSN